MKKTANKSKRAGASGSRPTISKREGKMVQKKTSKPQRVTKIKAAAKPIARPATRHVPTTGAKPMKFTPTRRKLTAAEVKEFKQALLAIRVRLSGQINSLKSDSLKRQDEVNTVEDGTDAFERQFALNIASTENDSLFEIEEALRRIDEGTFGICEMSGEPIELERLKAIPYARFSLAAQSELEKGKAPYRQSSVMRAL